MNIGTILVNQFKKPCGLLGRLVGHIMASRSSNIQRGEWTLSLLNLQPSDRVLEIGFGPGVAIEQASQMVQQGTIVGIDHSDIMLKQASKRNAKAIKDGLVTLLLGDETVLKTLGQSFHTIYSINVVQFWPDPEAVFKRLYEALISGGVLATTYMPRQLHKKSQHSEITAAEMVAQLTSAGFSDIQIEKKIFESAPAISVLAYKH